MIVKRLGKITIYCYTYIIINSPQTTFKEYHMIIWHKKRSYLEHKQKELLYIFCQKGTQNCFRRASKDLTLPFTPQEARLLHKIMHLRTEYQYSYYSKCPTSKCFYKRASMDHYEEISKLQGSRYPWTES